MVERGNMTISNWANLLFKLTDKVESWTGRGRRQVIEQLDAIRLNLEQFKEAVREDDLSKMRQLLAECGTLSLPMEKQLFKVLDDESSEKANKVKKHAFVSKARIVKGRTRQSSIPLKIRKAFEEKNAALASAIIEPDQRNRQKLLAEIDTAIGTLSGIAKTLRASRPSGSVKRTRKEAMPAR